MDTTTFSLNESFGSYQNAGFRQRDIQNCPLCCRTFFLEQETIPAPESLQFQFKGYRFPLTSQQGDRIKKTICSFLNCKGGFIYVGINENVQTKQHKARGFVYNETQREQIHRYLRKCSECIQPEIILNRKMEVYFIPIKSMSFPYSFVPGKCIVKIKVFPGAKSDIYTTRNDDGQLIVCMRTQNEVLTYDPKREFRKLLSIQKERIQNPYDLSAGFYSHSCKKPQSGIRVFSVQNKFQPHKVDRLDDSRRTKLTLANKCTVYEEDETSDIDIHKNNFDYQRKNRILQNISQDSEFKCPSSNDSQFKNTRAGKKQWKKRKLQEKMAQIEVVSQLQKNNKNQEKTQQIDVLLVEESEKSYQSSNSNQSFQDLSSVSHLSQGKNKPKSKFVQHEQKTHLNLTIMQQTKKQINQRKSSQPITSGKTPLELRELALEKYLLIKMDKNYVRQLVNCLFGTNYMSHRMLGFSGFSDRGINLIKEQFKKINQTNFVDFKDLMFYQFDKSVKQNDLKNAIFRSLYCQESEGEIPLPNQLKKIQFNNTYSKKKKRGRNQCQSFQIQSMISGANLSNSKRTVFKLTNTLQVTYENRLYMNIQQNIEELRTSFQKMISKSSNSNICCLSLQQAQINKQQTVHKIKFHNLLFAFISFLQFRKNQIKVKYV